MKILLVSPVPEYAVWEVYQGWLSGLRALGTDVVAWNYNRTWTLFDDFKKFALVTGRAAWPGPDVQEMAGARVVIAALDHDVDLAVFIAPMHTAPITLERLRKQGIKTAACFTESPYDDETQLPWAELFDYCFVTDKSSVERFRAVNPQSFYVGHGYDPERHKPNGGAKDIDALAIMTMFRSRAEFMSEVDWRGIDLHLYGITQGIGNAHPLHRFVRGGTMDNSSAVRLYQRANVAFQVHRTDQIDQAQVRRDIKRGRRQGVLGAVPIADLDAYSIGPRCYELAACGTFQVCDDARPELREVFGDAVPTFTTPAQLGDLLRRYLDDPVAREELAERQRAAVQLYTFSERMRSVLEAVA